MIRTGRIGRGGLVKRRGGAAPALGVAISRALSSLAGLGESPTMARTSTDWCIDNEGIRREIPAGAPRFDGFRTVINLATQLTSHNITVDVGRTYAVTIAGDVGATCVCSGAFAGSIEADGTNRITFPDGAKTATTTTLTLTVFGTLTELQVEESSTGIPSEWIGID